jgi:nucleotide-binding universal stress UspA family protein
MKIPTILVPVDESERARQTVREAASIARRFNSKLLLLHAEPPPVAADYDGTELAGEQEAWEAEELSQLARNEAPEAAVELRVVRGEVIASILEICREQPIDLIAMSTRGQGDYRRFLLGSNTAKALHDAACPVLTGAHREAPVEACYPYKRIACLIDFQSDYRRALLYADDFAASCGAELIVVHIPPTFHPEASPQDDFGNIVQSSARLRLEKLLQEEGVQAQLIVKSGELESTLPPILERGGADLLVINRCEQGQEPGVSSRAYAVILSSPCPVLSI